MPDYAWLTVAVLCTAAAVVIGCTAYLEHALRDVLGPDPELDVQRAPSWPPAVDGCTDCAWIRDELGPAELGRHLASEHGIVLLPRELARHAESPALYSQARDANARTIEGSDEE